MILYVIMASQDFEKANHRGLWEALSRLPDTDVVVANIPADVIVSRLKNHRDRIDDAKRAAEVVNKHLWVFRPMFPLRAEISPKFLHNDISRRFWKSVDHVCCGINRYKEVRLIIYNAFWAKILANSIPNLKIGYYLFDEVRNNASDNSVNLKRYREDLSACQLSYKIFAMSQKIADARPEFSSKMTVLGNGASVYDGERQAVRHKSVAFIGNFRDWIDMELLTNLIQLRKDIDFYFVGPIEQNMHSSFNALLNQNTNVFYCGCVDKIMVHSMYTMFNMIIIPYKQNEFIEATRPIKIVESVLSGTPVITIPMCGYEESEYIRFAKDVETFSTEIDFLLNHPIDRQTEAYRKFADENAWEAKAKSIHVLFK